jgi:hypothetical protein
MEYRNIQSACQCDNKGDQLNLSYADTSEVKKRVVS